MFASPWAHFFFFSYFFGIFFFAYFCLVIITVRIQHSTTFLPLMMPRPPAPMALWLFLGRKVIYFQGAGNTSGYFQGAWEQAVNFGGAGEHCQNVIF